MFVSAFRREGYSYSINWFKLSLIIFSKLGESISIWQDGQVVTLTPEQIPPINLDH